MFQVVFRHDVNNHIRSDGDSELHPHLPQSKMGLFGLFGSSDQSTQKGSKDGVSEPPNRTQREHCYEARDIFYGCLDRHNIIDSLKDEKLAAEKCGPEGQMFEKNCASTWVSCCR